MAKNDSRHDTFVMHERFEKSFRRIHRRQGADTALELLYAMFAFEKAGFVGEEELSDSLDGTHGIGATFDEIAETMKKDNDAWTDSRNSKRVSSLKKKVKQGLELNTEERHFLIEQGQSAFLEENGISLPSDNQDTHDSKSKPTVKKNSFTNYEQREYDTEGLEELFDPVSRNQETVNEQTTDYEWLVEAWNSLSSVGITPIKSILKGSERAEHVRATSVQHGKEDFLEAIENIRKSRFLQGKDGNGKHWIITFDWFVIPSNFQKVLEGNYNNKTSTRDELLDLILPD